MRWANFFHIYQPPDWNADIIRQVAAEAYWPLVHILDRHPQVKITMNITGALTEQLLELGLDDLLSAFRRCLERGQIELVGSAMYHPILPLLPLEEVRRQIELQQALHQRVFGPAYKPTGFFAPEMAFAAGVESLLQELGFQWIIIDEIAVTGTIGQAPLETRLQTAGNFGVVIRNRPISDFLSFTAQLENSQAVWQQLKSDTRSSNYLVTAMDGENLGHHRHGVDRLWEELVSHPEATMLTVSEYLQALTKKETVTLHAASWSSQPHELTAGIPFGLWNHPANAIHKLQWELTQLVILTVHRAAADPGYESARRLLDRALTSDKYWWASASPWWDMTIVIRETQRLADVISPLTTVSATIKNKVARLIEQLARTTELWDKTGLAKKRQATYLKDTGDVKFMGGQQVTS